MLDDRDGGVGCGIEFADEFVGRVGVVDVVVGKFFAADLFRGRDAEAVFAGDIEGRRLMRVLAVTQALLEFAAEGEAARGRALFCFLAVGEFAFEPICDRCVVGRGAGVGPGGERVSGCVNTVVARNRGFPRWYLLYVS